MKYHTTKISVNDFLSAKTLAIAGVSRDKTKFGNYLFHELKNININPVPVNPHVSKIDNVTCYPSLSKIPKAPEAVVIVLPPDSALKVVEEAIGLGIKKIWLQQGSESSQAIEKCLQNNVNIIAGECLLMFMEPVGSFHKWHKFVWKLLGRLPR